MKSHDDDENTSLHPYNNISGTIDTPRSLKICQLCQLSSTTSNHSNHNNIESHKHTHDHAVDYELITSALVPL